MAKGAYIGVPKYNSEFDGKLVYDPTSDQWNSQTRMDISDWVKGTTYVYNVEINGVVYRDMYFLPDVGASWINYDVDTFDLMVGVGGWIYLNDYGLGLDTSAPCIIRIYTGEPVSVARKVKSGYVGIPTNIPIYEEQETATTITASNITDFFTVTDGSSYYFKGNGGTFTSNNAGYDSTTATSTWTAKVDMSSVSLNYSVSSESNYDKLTIKIGDTTVANTISGNLSGTGTGSLTKGQTIQLTYSKDSSSESGNDCGTISNIVVVCNQKTLVGTETKAVARKIKKAYVGVDGVAKLMFSND